MTITRCSALFVYSFVLYVHFVALTTSLHAATSENIETLTPEELLPTLQAKQSVKPLVLHVGPRILYAQAHIVGSESMGQGSTSEGLQALRKRASALPKNTLIVLYCGCCPWSHCPNVNPAYDLLRGLGFTNVKVLYIQNNFGTDWVDKGYPVAKGE